MNGPTTLARLSALALFAFIALIAPGLGAASFAQTAPTPTTPTPTAPAPTEVRPLQDAGALTGALDVTIDIRADRTAQMVTTRRLTVRGEAAVQIAGQQTFTYIEGMQTVEIVEAYTHKADGTKVEVDRATIFTRDAATGLGAVYLRDLKVVTIIFPDVSVGDSVVFTTRTDNKSGIFAGHFYSQFAFVRSYPFSDSTIRVAAPKDLPLNVATLGDGIEHQRTDDGDVARHVIVYRGRPTIAAERGATAALDRDPRVFISTFKDYADQAQSYWTPTSAMIAVTPEIARMAEEITKGVEDRRAQAVAISNWVKRNIRYVAVYLGAARVVPNSAASVLKNRYGDCKDHVTLMSALLAAKGIASEHVLISAGNAYTLPEPPTMAYINHVIVYLPEFGVYDDPTVNYAAFGVLSTGTYDKPVVHISAEGARRARTPAMKPGDHVSTRRTRITIAADGTVSGETEQLGTGIFATIARSIAASIQRDGLERSAEQRLRNSGTPGKGRFTFAPLTELSDAYTVAARFTLTEPMKIEPPKTQQIPVGLPIQVGPGNYLLNARHPGRTTPFVCLAGVQVEEIEMTFAEGLPLPRGIRGRTISTKTFSYKAEYRLEGRTFRIRREFISNVPGQVCAPEVEAEITAPMADVRDSLTTRMGFFVPPKKAVPPSAQPPGQTGSGRDTREGTGVTN